MHLWVLAKNRNSLGGTRLLVNQAWGVPKDEMSAENDRIVNGQPRTTKRRRKVTPEEMDRAAEEAAKELNPNGSAAELATWWKKHYTRSGHKRLGRVLLNTFAAKPTALPA